MVLILENCWENDGKVMGRSGVCCSRGGEMEVRTDTDCHRKIHVSNDGRLRMEKSDFFEAKSSVQALH